MKATISRDDLLTLLTSVSRYGTTKTILDILKFGLLKAKEGKISISATDLETETTAIIPAIIEAEGEILVPIKRIYDLCKSLPDVNIKLSLTENHKLKLNWGNNATIAILDTTDFPAITAFDENDSDIISISTESLKEVLPQVTFAAATDESRPVLAGVYLTTNMLQSADGYRASFVKFHTLGDIIIPAVALDGFYKLLCGNQVNIQNSDKKAIFQLEDGTVFTSNSIQGEFPDTKAILSHETDADLKLTFDTKQLLSVLKQAEVFSDERVGLLVVAASENGFDIRIKSDDNEFQANIPAIKTEGHSEIKFGISLKYLSGSKEGVLPRVTSEFVKICLSGNGSNPIVLKSGDFTHIIMPMEIRKRG
ncbi:MAG TPA: DNA polymerase III subunit beta [bacterium]|nr:DNA polymerase III subunit beta [bacterium]